MSEPCHILLSPIASALTVRRPNLVHFEATSSTSIISICEAFRLRAVPSLDSVAKPLLVNDRVSADSRLLYNVMKSIVEEDEFQGKVSLISHFSWTSGTWLPYN